MSLGKAPESSLDDLVNKIVTAEKESYARIEATLKKLKSKFVLYSTPLVDDLPKLGKACKIYRPRFNQPITEVLAELEPMLSTDNVPYDLILLPATTEYRLLVTKHQNGYYLMSPSHAYVNHLEGIEKTTKEALHDLVDEVAKIFSSKIYKYGAQPNDTLMDLFNLVGRTS